MRRLLAANDRAMSWLLEPFRPILLPIAEAFGVERVVVRLQAWIDRHPRLRAWLDG